MMKKEDKKASVLTFIGNLFLFIIKIIVGVIFNSIGIISDSFNSLLDVVSSGIIHKSISVSHKGPDKKHQFGHSRAQPIAGLIVAIFTAVFGFQICLSSVNRLFSGEKLELGLLPLFVMVLVMITKIGFFIYTKLVLRKVRSIALEAANVDHRNDILVSGIVLIGLIVSNLGWLIFDAIAGVVVSIYIIFSGYSLARDNIKYIMGEAPNDEVFELIEKAAMNVKGVIGINDMRAHLLGSEIDCEVHIYVDKKLNIMDAHQINHDVKKNIEKIRDIQNVFIHIDPYLGKMISKRKF